MLLNSLLKKLFIIWVTAISVFAMGVSATPENEEGIEFAPIPQLIAPKQAEGLENYLFDHDVNTRYPASLSSQIFTALGTIQTLDAIRVYGNAAYSLTVRANQQGRWTFVADLENRDLSALQPDQWHEFKITTCITTTDLLFDLTPVFQLQEENIGLREIEIWVKKTPGCPIESTELKKVAGFSGDNQTLENTGKTLLSSSTAKTEKVVPGQAKKISHEEAELDINAEAVKTEKDVSIETLDDSTLPALDAGMTNVTKGPRKGYRFLPSGKFNKKINVKIPYDKNLLPAGKTEEEINTYYFDKELGRWQMLKRVTLDKQGKNIVSETDHFTDMINATVTVPESPQSVLFNPTQIKDIKAADPSTGINFIEPPQVNNSGDVRLQYPIEIPPGRVGMQPQVAIGYNSAGGNGWVGMGWDVSIPAVTIDTRWGVPRYNSGQESETYLLSGEQLTPVAHRDVLQPRTPEKQFYPRVEGGFNKIIRHGTNPKNYCWEVTDKNGTISHYGCDATTNTPVGDSVLTDDQGNIFKWLLRETKDLHGNTVQYRGEIITDVGLPAGTVPGRDLYIKTINYTGFNGQVGPYQVKFVRSRDLGEGRRVDAIINGRGGFKQVTADLLRKIEITYQGQMVRSYELKYQESPLGRKALLATISQLGEDGSVFHTHTLEYYNDVIGGLFGNSQGWNTGRDNVSAGLPGPLSASAMSGTKSDSVGGHLYVGINLLLPEKKMSVGGKVGYSRTKSDGLLAQLDVNGDSLPDKVYKRGHTIFYRPNQSGPNGTTTFGNARVVGNLAAISKGSSSMFSGGAEIFLGASIGFNIARTSSTTTIYFIDVNSDGLIDIVNGGTVLFNHLDENGNPYFTPNNADTIYPIGSGMIQLENLIAHYEALRKEFVKNSPLLDTVRRWVAPYDGQVRISGTVALVEDTSPERQHYTYADGVKVTIQHNDSELWSTRIEPDDYTEKSPTGTETIAVSKDDEIFFRVQSVEDGSYDQVRWQPEIQYLEVEPTLDANQKDAYRYQATEDFVLNNYHGVSMTLPVAGKVRIQAELDKLDKTTDDVSLVLLKNEEAIYEQTLSWQAIGTLALAQDIDVAMNDRIAVRVKIDSPIDATKIQWHPDKAPTLFYLSSEFGSIAEGEDEPVEKMELPYRFDIYSVSNLAEPLQAWEVPTTDTYTVSTALSLTETTSTTEDNNLYGYPNSVPSEEEQTPAEPKPINATVMVTVKRPGELLGKREIKITEGQLENVEFAVNAQQGEQLYVEFSTVDPELADKLGEISVTVKGSGGQSYTVPTGLYSTSKAELVPPAYRGWSVFGYDGEGEQADKPVDVELSQEQAEALKKQIDELQAKAESATLDSLENEEMPKISGLKVFPYFPKPAQQRLQSVVDEESFVQADSMSSSRIGADSLELPPPGIFAGARGIPKIGKSRQMSIMLGAGFLSGSMSRSSGSGLTDMLDFNGDRFPDLYTGCIQYTNMLGGLDAFCGGTGGDVRGNKGDSFNFGVGGNYPLTRSRSNGSAGPTSNQMASLGLSGNLTKADTEATFDFYDVNGDGLPDRVRQAGGSLNVELNLGYRFASAESWGSAAISKDEGLGASLGGSAGMNDGLYGLGGGISLSKSANKSKQILVDANGDGLPDNASGSSVSFNTGSGFHGDGTGLGGKASETADLTMGGGVYFTIPIPIGAPPAAGFYIIINPGFDLNRSVSRAEVSLADVDGDGNPDYVETERDNSMKVRLSQVKRTNMLKTVHNPIGGSFTVDYARTGNTFAQPSNHWVMSRLEINDGHPGDGEDVLVSTYQYLDGFYNRLERDSYGFKTVIEEVRNHTQGDALYRTTTRTFLNNSYYNKGLLIHELTTDANGKKYLETENTYFLRDVFSNSELTNVDDYFKNLTNSVFPELRRVDKRFYEGQEQPGKATYETYEYDAVGNVIRFFDAADVGGQDDIEAVIGYFKDEAKHLFKANSIVVTSNGVILRKRDSLISGVGDVTQVSQYLADGGAVVANIAYDRYGNITTMTGPSNYKGQRYSLDYTYDSQVFTHNTKVRDSFGYVSSGRYNLKYGKPENTTDVNNKPLDYVYDAFGRVKTIIGPYQAGTANYTLNFEYHPEARPAYAITQHFDKYRDVSDPIETVLFVDGIKRAIQTKKDATIHVGDNGQAQDKMVASGHVVFDFLGRSIAQYYPVVENLGNKGVFNPNIDNVPPTTTEYDVLDRTVRVTLPDNTSTTTSYGFGNDRIGQLQFLTRVVDANGIPKESYRDIGENITSVKEFNNSGSQIIWTSYEYDPLGQIVKVLDNMNNLTQATYDNLGRRTSLNNPDTGLVETVYDLASNVIKKITPNLRTQGGAIIYDYEFTRLKSITYPNYAGNNVTYTYGGPGADCNRANRIVTVKDESGTEEFCYGPLGETVKTIKTVASETQGNSKNSPEIYTTLFEFDTFNRLQKLTYPDGELLTNHYDSGGLLRQITGTKDNRDYEYVNRLEYDKFDQRAFVKFGNGVISKYDYNPLNRRLANLDSRTKGKENQFQDLAYDYDNVGNILGQANRAAIKSPSQMGGATRHQYVYDDLYRLVHANGTFDTQPDKQHRYTFDMQYDSIHNILNKNQYHDLVQPSQQTLVQAKTTYDWSYEYKGTQPHAPTHIGLRTFSYDANGNQTGWTHDENGTWRQIVWDEENRIQQIIDNNHIFDYKYNHAGERVIKTGPQGETVYVNQFFVIRGGSVASKHVFAGTTRMVTKLAMQENTSVKGMNTLAVTSVPLTTETQSVSPRRLFGMRKMGNGNGNAGGNSDNPNSNAGGNSADSNGQTKNEPGYIDNPGKACDGSGNAAGNCPKPTPEPTTPSNPVVTVTPPAEVTPPVSDGTGTTAPPVSDGTTTTPSVTDGTPAPVTSPTTDKQTGKPVDNTIPPAPSGGGNPPTTDKPKPDNGKGPAEHQLYFYHPDHLGSTGYVTDDKGAVFQHIEYFPFGETWVEESSNTQRTPYGFTGKELDEDTGLHYFGARYYDARTSVWASVDPILGSYLDGKPNGGVLVPFNLGLYNYSRLNPIAFQDPDGRSWAAGLVVAGLGAAVVGAIRAEILILQSGKGQEFGQRKMDFLIWVSGIFGDGGGNVEARQLATNFRNGSGSPVTCYNSDHPLTESIKNSPKIRDSVKKFYQKNKGSTSELQPVKFRSWYGLKPPKGWKVDGNSAFGPLEFIESTVKSNLTEHVLGSFDIDIKANGDMLDITVTNTTDMDSLYGETKLFNYNAKNLEGGPLGTMKQVFHWTIPIDQERLK